jgi:hypothetical protein
MLLRLLAWIFRLFPNIVVRTLFHLSIGLFLQFFFIWFVLLVRFLSI